MNLLLAIIVAEHSLLVRLLMFLLLIKEMQWNEHESHLKWKLTLIHVHYDFKARGLLNVITAAVFAPQKSFHKRTKKKKSCVNRDQKIKLFSCQSESVWNPRKWSTWIWRLVKENLLKTISNALLNAFSSLTSRPRPLRCSSYVNCTVFFIHFGCSAVRWKFSVDTRVAISSVKNRKRKWWQKRSKFDRKCDVKRHKRMKRKASNSFGSEKHFCDFSYFFFITIHHWTLV